MSESDSPRAHAPVALWCALTIYTLLTIALIAKVPLNLAPDESAHAEYIEAIASTHRLPIFSGQVPPAPGYEFHQPPLYYLLGSILWMILPAGVENYAARGLSLVFGALTIWVVWKMGRLIFGQKSLVPGMAALFLALLPMHQGLGAYVNNDSLAGLISAGLFYWMAKVWLEGATTRNALCLGLVVGAGGLTKLTCLLPGAVAVLCLLFAALKQERRPIPVMGTAIGIALLLMSPMMIRNQGMTGDPFNYVAFSKAATTFGPGFDFFAAQGLSLATYAKDIVWMILLTTWGFYGGPNAAWKATQVFSPSGPAFLPADSYLWLFFAACTLVPLAALVGLRRDKAFSTKNLPASALKTILIWWGVGIAIVVLAWANFAYAHFAGGQARYLHPAIAPVALLLCAGWVALWGEGKALKLASTLFGVVLLFLTLLNVFGWQTLL